MLSHQKKTVQSTSATPIAIPAPELLRFLELSIGQKIDAYLLKLALRDARTESIAETSEKLLIHLKRLEQTTSTPEASEAKKVKPISGIVSVPKAVLSTSGYWIGLKFTVFIDAISDTKRSRTALMKHLSIPELTPNTVLFWNRLNIDTAFTLGFSDIELAFNITTSKLYSGQEFNAEILLTDNETIDLHLVEKFPLALSNTALQASHDDTDS